MSFLLRFSAILLAVIWLPMTLHCPLASLDLGWGMPKCCDGDSFACCDKNCDSGVCHTIETGDYLPQRSEEFVSLSSWSVLGTGFLPDFIVFPPPMESSLTELGAPPGRWRMWQFEFRAAAQPRAPSALV